MRIFVQALLRVEMPTFVIAYTLARIREVPLKPCGSYPDTAGGQFVRLRPRPLVLQLVRADQDWSHEDQLALASRRTIRLRSKVASAPMWRYLPSNIACRNWRRQLCRSDRDAVVQCIQMAVQFGLLFRAKRRQSLEGGTVFGGDFLAGVLQSEIQEYLHHKIDDLHTLIVRRGRATVPGETYRVDPLCYRLIGRPDWSQQCAGTDALFAVVVDDDEFQGGFAFHRGTWRGRRCKKTEKAVDQQAIFPISCRRKPLSDRRIQPQVLRPIRWCEESHRQAIVQVRVQQERVEGLCGFDECAMLAFVVNVGGPLNGIGAQEVEPVCRIAMARTGTTIAFELPVNLMHAFGEVGIGIGQFAPHGRAQTGRCVQLTPRF